MSSIERTIELRFRHRVYFTKNVFGLGNTRLKEVLAGEGSLIPKVLVILDESLHHAHRQELCRGIRRYCKLDARKHLL